MSVLKSKRNESTFLYAHMIISLYKFTRIHITKISKKAGREKHLILDATDDLLTLAFQANSATVRDLESYNRLIDIYEQMDGLLDLISNLLTTLREEKLIEDATLVQWTQLLDNEVRLVSTSITKVKQNYEKMKF